MAQEQKEVTSKDGAEMVLIPEGEFLMGSPEGEGGADEQPRHPVYLNSFYMDKYEVTVAQYKKYCQTIGITMPEQPHWSSDKHPVVNVFWDDATAYAKYYGKEVPTEAQWEKACRAGTKTKYAFGDVLDASMAKFDSGDGAVPVGSYKPNGYGLYDMHGNVGEWCSDWYREDYYKNSLNKNPQGPNFGSVRVLRGGGWVSYDDGCRSAYRKWSSPGLRDFSSGFRCVDRSGANSSWQSESSGNLGLKNAKETYVNEVTREKNKESGKNIKKKSNLIGGKYEIYREIGKGGMGIVFEGMDTKLKRKVAIKQMREELKINIRAKRKFLEEAVRVAKLQHPNIVAVYDIVEEESEVYLIFEFIDGKTIDALLDKQGKFEATKTAEIAIGVCETLIYAHTEKIIHRDIKPANIMVSTKSIVKIMDFGIAREMQNTVSRVTGEQSSGTFAYMAPEQEMGKGDERVDIYALGVTMYEMLTSDLPFKGPNFLAQKREMAYTPIHELEPDIPEALEKIVDKCLQADPEDRYKTAEKMSEALGKI